MFTSNFRLNHGVTLTWEGFICEPIPAEVAKEELKWQSRTEPALNTHKGELERKIQVHHRAVMRAYREMPILYNQLCVTEALLEVHPDHQAARDAATLSNAVSRERDRLIRLDNAQILLDARKNRRNVTAASMYEEELGPVGGAADEADMKQDEQETKRARESAERTVCCRAKACEGKNS